MKKLEGRLNGSLPKDRPWGYNGDESGSWLALSWYKDTPVRQIAREMARTPEYIEQKLKELPAHRAEIDFMIDRYAETSAELGLSNSKTHHPMPYRDRTAKAV